MMCNTGRWLAPGIVLLLLGGGAGWAADSSVGGAFPGPETGEDARTVSVVVDEVAVLPSATGRSLPAAPVVLGKCAPPDAATLSDLSERYRADEPLDVPWDMKVEYDD